MANERIIRLFHKQNTKKMKKLLLTVFNMLGAVGLTAQNIDFDLPGKTAPGKDTEVNYISWAVPRTESDTKSFDNGMTITICDFGIRASETEYFSSYSRSFNPEIRAGTG